MDLETHAKIVKGARKKRYSKKGKAIQRRYEKFAKVIVETGNKTEAYRQAFPKANDTSSNLTHGGERLLQRPDVQNMIKKIDERLMSEGEKSIAKLVDLREGAEKETVQLDAAVTLLNSYHQVMKRLTGQEEMKNVTNNILVTGMTDDDLLARIQLLHGEQTKE